MRTRITVWSSWSDWWTRKARGPSAAGATGWVTCKRATTPRPTTATTHPNLESGRASGSWTKSRSTSAATVSAVLAMTSFGSFLFSHHRQFFWKIGENFILKKDSNTNQKPSILINFQCESLEFRYKLCSHYFSYWSHWFLIRKLIASCFESQKTVNVMKIIVKMCEICFVQTKIFQLALTSCYERRFHFWLG